MALRVRSVVGLVRCWNFGWSTERRAWAEVAGTTVAGRDRRLTVGWRWAGDQLGRAVTMLGWAGKMEK